MSAADTAETFLIVIKRLLKWALWAILGFLFLVAVVWAVVWGQQYFEKRPYQAIRYAALNLGDPQKEVIYAMGPPAEYLMPSPPPSPGAKKMPWDSDKMVQETDESYATKETFLDSTSWLYPQDQKRLDVEFDNPGGKVISITCFSSGSYRCPSIYGIRDGSYEDEVVTHLGRPASDRVDGTTKRLQYPQYNLTLYLNKRQVYLLKLSTNATL